MTEDTETNEGASDADEQPPHEVAAGAGELIRDALVDDDDPRFPIWLPLPGIAAALGWALYDANVGAGSFVPALLWPGGGIFLLTTVATWLGWQLDID